MPIAWSKFAAKLSRHGFHLAYRHRRSKVIGFFRRSPVPFCYEMLRVEEVADRSQIWSLAIASTVPDAMHSLRNSHKKLVPDLPHPKIGGTTDVRSPERIAEWEEAFLRIAPSFCTAFCVELGPSLVAETLFARQTASWFLRQLKWRDRQPVDALDEFQGRTTPEQQELARKILTPSLLDSFLVEDEVQDRNAMATLKLASLALTVFWSDSPFARSGQPWCKCMQRFRVAPDRDVHEQLHLQSKALESGAAGRAAGGFVSQV